MNVLDGERREFRRVLVNGSEAWGEIVGDVLRVADGREFDPENLVHLPPCRPTKIVCVHLNYASRFFEFRGRELPAGHTLNPTYFLKPTTTLNAHGGEIVRPEGYRYLNYEGEVAAVIGRPTRNVRPDQVWDHLAGFACALDMGLQDMRDTDAGSMLRVKGADGFCPVGPGLVSGVDIREQTLRTVRNGVVVQEGSLSEMIWGIDVLVADVARHITLLPGDIVLTGTPANSRPLDVGDSISVEVTGLGRLACSVVESPPPVSVVGHQPNDSDEVRRVALGCDERLPPQLQGTNGRARRT